MFNIIVSKLNKINADCLFNFLSKKINKTKQVPNKKILLKAIDKLFNVWERFFKGYFLGNFFHVSAG